MEVQIVETIRQDLHLWHLSVSYDEIAAQPAVDQDLNAPPWLNSLQAYYHGFDILITRALEALGISKHRSCQSQVHPKGL